MYSNLQSTKVIVFNYVSFGNIDMAHIINGMTNTFSKVEVARGCSSRCFFIWWELTTRRRYEDSDNIKACFYSIEAKFEIVEIVAIINLLPFLLCKCVINSPIETKMLYPCCIWSHNSPREPCYCENNVKNHPSQLLGPLGVRQLLSLYFQFYKVTMLESTNATGERRTWVCF
jgi:hypothetical protein